MRSMSSSMRWRGMVALGLLRRRLDAYAIIACLHICIQGGAPHFCHSALFLWLVGGWCRHRQRFSEPTYFRQAPLCVPTIRMSHQDTWIVFWVRHPLQLPAQNTADRDSVAAYRTAQTSLTAARPSSRG